MFNNPCLHACPDSLVKPKQDQTTTHTHTHRLQTGSSPGATTTTAGADAVQASKRSTTIPERRYSSAIYTYLNIYNMYMYIYDEIHVFFYRYIR